MEDMMRGKIPKSELLVTFEVVARHESYTRAAEELALTQSAVFRQVTALEEFLHTSLFNHAKKRIFLNAAGKHYLNIVKETLNKLETALADVPYGEAKEIMAAATKLAPKDSEPVAAPQPARAPRTPRGAKKAETPEALRAKRAAYAREYRARQAALKAAEPVAPTPLPEPPVLAPAPAPIEPPAE